MNRPKFYKSFRSRRYHESKNLQASIQDLLNESKKIILDIGFGTGESTIDLNDIYEDHLVCGVEAYKPGIQRLNNKNIPNHYGDALEFIEQMDKNTISKIYMLFPDPWQKKKHRKRRLLNEYTFSIINKILLKEGMLHFATDNINYAIEAIITILKEIQYEECENILNQAYSVRARENDLDVDISESDEEEEDNHEEPDYIFTDSDSD